MRKRILGLVLVLLCLLAPAVSGAEEGSEQSEEPVLSETTMLILEMTVEQYGLGKQQAEKLRDFAALAESGVEDEELDKALQEITEDDQLMIPAIEFYGKLKKLVHESMKNYRDLYFRECRPIPPKSYGKDNVRLIA